MGRFYTKVVCLARMGFLFFCCLFCFHTTLFSKVSSGTTIVIEEDNTYEDESEDLPPLLHEPEILKSTRAHYPKDISKLGIEGTVLLALLVDKSGRVESVSLLSGIHPLLDSNALLASKDLLFSPAIDKDSTPVPIVLHYEYQFSLQEVVKHIDECVNFTGSIREYGTRKPLGNTVVSLEFIDSLSDSTIPVPLPVYIDRIGNIQGQHLEEKKLITTTDSLGVFSFFNIPVCRLQVTVYQFGYQTVTERIVIPSNKKIVQKIALKKDTHSDFEIAVYGRKKNREISCKTLNIDEIKKIPGLAGDAIKVVQAFPGVARPMFSSGELIIRGSANGDNKYFMDGVRIPKLYHAYGLLSTYNSDLLQSIDFYPGGFGSRYGGAIAGVIEIKSRSPKKERNHFKANISSLDASFLSEGPMSSSFSYATSGRVSYIGPVMKKITQHTDMTVVPDYWDIISRLEYTKKNVKSFLQYFSSNDEMRVINRGSQKKASKTQNNTYYRDHITFHTLSYGLDNSLSENITNEFRASVQKFDRSRKGFNSYNNYSEDYEVNLGSIRDECLFAGNDIFSVKTGLDFELFTIYNGLSSDTKYYSLAGVYSNLLITLLNDLTILPGIRYDYYHEVQDGKPSFRITSRYDFIKNHTVKAAVGTYNKTPDPIGVVIDKQLGNPDIPLTLSTQYCAGYEWLITNLLSLDIQGYYTLQENIPRQTTAKEVSQPSGGGLFYRADMDGRMYGLEVLLRHHLGKTFFGWLSYTLSKSERRSPYPPSFLSYYGNNWDPKKWFLYEKDQTHNIQLIGSWKISGNWQAGFRFRYVTGNPTLPLNVYAKNMLTSDSEFGVHIKGNGTIHALPPNETNNKDMGSIYSNRMDPFIQLDLRVDNKVVFKNWILTTYIDIQNVNYFWYNSPEYYYYNSDSKSKDVIGGMILPKLGISLDF